MKRLPMCGPGVALAAALLEAPGLEVAPLARGGHVRGFRPTGAFTSSLSRTAPSVLTK